MNIIKAKIKEAFWEYKQLADQEAVISNWIEWWLMKHEEIANYCLEHRYDTSCTPGFPCACYKSNELYIFSVFYLHFQIQSRTIREEKKVFHACKKYDESMKTDSVNKEKHLYDLLNIGDRIYGQFQLSALYYNEDFHNYTIDDPHCFDSSYPSIASYQIDPKVIKHFIDWYVRVRPIRQDHFLKVRILNRLWAQ